MARLCLTLCLICTSLGAGSAALDDSTCATNPGGSKDACEGPDTSGLLQSRVVADAAEDDELQLTPSGESITEAACSVDDDTNCCFTQAGVDYSIKTRLMKLKAGDCAKGAKALAGGGWTKFFNAKTLETCPTGKCAKAKPAGTCAEWTCKSGTKKNPTAPCTEEKMCNFNCCEVDLKQDTVMRAETLTFGALMAMQNLTLFFNNEHFPRLHVKADYDADMVTLLDGVSGLFVAMRKLNSHYAYCPMGKPDYIRTCLHMALCVLEHDTPRTDDKAMKTFNFVQQQYAKFDDIAWDSLIGDLNMLDPNKKQVKADKVDPKEMSCGKVAHFLGKSFMQTAEDADGDSSRMTAYRASTAFLDAAQTTHDLLDSHASNSSVDETVSALHRAWEHPCKLLTCDHTNYWDLVGATYSHGLVLLEAGASARHHKVFIRTRERLEHRMMLFLGKYGLDFGHRIYRTEGTKAESKYLKYGDEVMKAVHSKLKGHPEKYGVHSTLLGMVGRERISEFFNTPARADLLEKLWENRILIEPNEQASLLEDHEDQYIASEEEADEDQYMASDEEDLSLDDRLDRTLSRKGVAKAFSTVGKGIVKAGKAIGNGIATAAKAVGGAVVSFVKFIVSLLGCLGFGTAASIGYAIAFRSPIPALGVKFNLACEVKGNLMKGSFIGSCTAGVSSKVKFTFLSGKIPIGGPDTGVSVGVAIAATVACGASSSGTHDRVSKHGFDCVAEISVGLTVSASIALPSAENPVGRGRMFCPLGYTLEELGLPNMKCASSLGLTMKIICCKVSLVTGKTNCGGGGGGGGGDKKSQAKINAYVKSDGATGGPAPDKAGGGYYSLKKGSCCCPSGQEIKTKEACRSAHDAVGIPRPKEWVGSYGGIPGGCSSDGRYLHWNSISGKGRSRGDLTPLCIPRETQFKYYKMVKGSCCCKAGFEILTKEDCRKAIDAVGIPRPKEWSGNYGAIPGGCSTDGKYLHWNTFRGGVGTGSGRGDLTPLCTRAQVKFYAMKKGSCCCKGGQEITTKQQCQQASRFVGMPRSSVWDGSYGGIPGGCSHDGRSLHWNSISGKGRSRGDLAPLCVYDEASALKNLGGSGCTSSRKCDACKGDCDRDSDCATGLMCFQRNGHEVVPGCAVGGSGDTRGYDYCYKPAANVLQNLGGSGCTSSRKCGSCKGDCDRDSDCASGLKCFQRNGYEVVPGCKAGGSGDKRGYDYCYKPATVATYTLSGTPVTSITRMKGHISQSQWPQEFCINLDVTTPSSIRGYPDFALVGGPSGQCNGIYIYLRSGRRVGFGVQCNAGGSQGPISVANAYNPDGSRRMFNFCYSVLTKKATVYVDGTLRATAKKRFNFPRHGFISIFSGLHYRNQETMSGATLHSLTITKGTQA